MDRGDGFTLRRPRGWRIASAVLLPVWIGWLGFVLLGADERPPPAFLVIAALMVAYGVAMTIRTVRLAVVATAEELVVRNLWGTHRIPRSDITGFSTGRYQRVGHRTVYADRRSGRAVRLMALEQSFPLPGRERDVEPDLDRLEGWRAGVRPAVGG